MTTEILTSPDVDEGIITTEVADIDEGNDDDNLRHIVRPGDNPHMYQFKRGLSGQDVVDIAMVRKIKIKALCGREWIPSRSVEDRDTCNTCIDIAGMIRSGNIE